MSVLYGHHYKGWLLPRQQSFHSIIIYLVSVFSKTAAPLLTVYDLHTNTPGNNKKKLNKKRIDEVRTLIPQFVIFFLLFKNQKRKATMNFGEGTGGYEYSVGDDFGGYGGYAAMDMMGGTAFNGMGTNAPSSGAMASLAYLFTCLRAYHSLTHSLTHSLIHAWLFIYLLDFSRVYYLVYALFLSYPLAIYLFTYLL